MNKDEVLLDFVKGLRIALNTSSAYSKDHPYFIKAATDFSHKIYSTFAYINPIKMNISPVSLFIDGKAMGKGTLYTDLAYFFHLRKIKSIELKPGLSFTEITVFLHTVSQPIKEILRQGGLDVILQKSQSEHITVEPLDYSDLLRGEGEEVKDLWSYLFAGAISSQNESKIKGFADNFDKIIQKFRSADFLQNEELRQNLYSFLNYLKANDVERFNKCTKSFLKILLKDNAIAKDNRLSGLKIFFEGLGKDFFSDAIWELIAESGEGESLNFSTFFSLVDEITHQYIAPELQKKIHDTQLLSSNPHARKKLHDLILAEENSLIQPIYRKSLKLLTEEEQAGSISFDRCQVISNYYYAILNLLSAETHKEKLALIASRLSKDANVMITEQNIEFLNLLFGVLNKKISEDLSVGAVFGDFLRRISVFVENAIFEMEDPGRIMVLADKLRDSLLGIDFYMGKIFEEGKINPHILNLMFKLFPYDLDYFLDNLEKKKSDIDFLSKVIIAVPAANSAVGLEILKKIYYLSNNIIKLEVLKAMQSLNFLDEVFLFSVLNSDEAMFKKEALKELRKTEGTIKEALDALFVMPNYFGSKNNTIMQNLVIAQDLDLREAEHYILSISKLWFFWHSGIRDEAKKILRSWNAAAN